MRWLLALLITLAGCSSDAPPEATDAGGKSCATTSCVAGASCVTKPGGVRCACFETGKWTCGSVAEEPIDGGFDFDSGSGPSGGGDALVSPDSIGAGGYTLDVTGCGSIDACAGDDNPVGVAESLLASLMGSCGASCTTVRLAVGIDGCPYRIDANVEWMPGSLSCVAKEVARYRWPCGKEFQAMTRSCPE